MSSPWVTAAEAAKYLHVRRETFEAAAAQGQFTAYRDPALRMGGSDRRRFYDTRELDEWMRRGRVA